MSELTKANDDNIEAIILAHSELIGLLDSWLDRAYQIGQRIHHEAKKYKDRRSLFGLIGLRAAELKVKFAESTGYWYCNIVDSWAEIQAERQKRNGAVLTAAEVKLIVRKKPRQIEYKPIDDGWKENEHGVSVKKYPSGREFFLSPTEGGYRISIDPYCDEFMDEEGWIEGFVFVKSGAKARCDEIDARLSAKATEPPDDIPEGPAKVLRHPAAIAAPEQEEDEQPAPKQAQVDGDGKLVWTKKGDRLECGPYEIEYPGAAWRKYEVWGIEKV